MSKQQLNWLDRIPVQREELERIAYIIGRSSAAQQALDDADTHSGEVQFWRIGQTIVVEKLPTASVEDATCDNLQGATALLDYLTKRTGVTFTIKAG